MKKIFSILAIVSLLTSPVGVFAAASGSIVFDPKNLLQNLAQVGKAAIGNAQQLIATQATVALQVKEYALDQIAFKISQDMINRAAGDTINWINSGFQGGGPGFIVNPEAYLKNVANQELRIQLDALGKTALPEKNAISAALIKNVRSDRQSAAAQIQFTLLDTVRSETCTPANLKKIAENQVDSGLVTNTNDANLSRADKIAKRQGELNQELCSAASRNDPQANAKLKACFNSGACGGFKSTLDAFSERNSLAAQQAKFITNVKTSAANKADVAQKETSNGLLPEKVCQTRLTYDDQADTPYPDGQGPCVEWNIKTPVASIANELQKAQTGEYGKLTNVDSFGQLIGNALLNQATQALYKGLNNSLKSSGSGSLNTTYDNLLANNSKSLPATVLQKTQTTTPVVNPVQSDATIAKAKNYCLAIPENKKQYVVDICKHLSSNSEAYDIDLSFKAYSADYVANVEKLDSCINSLQPFTPVHPSLATWKNNNVKRKDAFGSSNLGDLSARMLVYPKSIANLSTTIVSVIESKDSGAVSDILTSYGSNISDSNSYVQLQQEKLSQIDFTSFKNQVSTQDKELPGEVNTCTSYLNQCQQNSSQGLSCNGNSGGDNGQEAPAHE